MDPTQQIRLPKAHALTPITIDDQAVLMISALDFTRDADSTLPNGDSQSTTKAEQGSLSAEDQSRERLMADMRQHFEKDGPVTLGYRLATNNRLIEHDLSPRRLDIDVYTPVFVHDVLMLPGSLAQLLGKVSETDLIPRLTPAYISGYVKVVDHRDHEATILPLPGSESRAYGMLVFGQGPKRRALIEEHYASSAVKTSVQATIEVAVALLPEHDDARERAQCQLKSITADAFIPTFEQAAELSGESFREWSLADFLQGKYLP